MAGSFECLRAFVQARVPLSAADWELVQAAFRPLALPKKGFYLHLGQSCDRIGFVAQGLLAASHVGEKTEVTTHIFSGGSFVADYYSYLTHTPSQQSIRALATCELLVAGRREITRLYASVSGWERLGRLIAEETYVCAHERTVSFLQDTAEQRYLKLTAAQPEILECVPHYVIASYLGITPEALSRIRGRLSGAGNC